MQWFRWYHGTCSDPKLGSVARKTSQTRERVIAVWALVLESASDAERRGAFSVDADGIADVLNCDAESVAAVLAEFDARGMTRRGVVVKWEARQPSRDDSSQRVKRYRERRKANPDVTRYARDINTQVTRPDTETEREKNNTHVPSGDGTSERVRKPNRTRAADYSADFLAVWQSLPSRGPASDSKVAAFRAYTSRLREGVSHADMLAAAHEYAERCEGDNTIGTRFVMQGATFLGPDRHWERFVPPPDLRVA